MLGHHIGAWDLRYGPCPVTMRTTSRKYAAKLFALTMMVVIGLWLCYSEVRQRNKQPKENLQQILFSEWGGGNKASSSSENRESQLNICAGLALFNRQVPECGWGAAHSHLAVGVEWAPDPPPTKLDPRHEY